MYFATDLWHVCIIRFLVAMGIGREWAVGASLVAETFPKRARAYTSGMFHSSSVLGIWIATCVGMIVGENWRYAYLVSRSGASVRAQLPADFTARDENGEGIGDQTPLFYGRFDRRRRNATAAKTRMPVVPGSGTCDVSNSAPLLALVPNCAFHVL